MDKKILAIFDSEEGYAYRLMEFITEKKNVPFEVYVFTNRDKLIQELKEETSKKLSEIIVDALTAKKVELIKG